MRIGIGQLWQETNTLNPCATTIDDFTNLGFYRGQQLVEAMGNVNELGGFVQSMRNWPIAVDMIGLARAAAWPSGVISAEAFDWFSRELREAIEDALPLDGVLLALHGAMVAEGHSDVEGEVLAMVRELIGPDVPLVATLDLHTNLTPRMFQHADCLVLYHCMPHVDIQNTGLRGGECLRRILFEDARPTSVLQRVPVVLPAEWSDTQRENSSPALRKEQLRRLEQRADVLSAGVAVVQPWMDIPDLGSAVVVTTNNDLPLARKLTEELATDLWRRREDYLPQLVSVEVAVKACHEAAHQLNVLSDAADATTSGAPGDSVWILDELLRYDWPQPALVTVVDPQVVDVCQQAGIDAIVSVTLGGKRDTRFGKQVHVEATVAHLFDARFIMTGHIGDNMPIDMGRAALLRSNNVHIVVTERTGPHFARELFETAGLDPFAASVFVAKSPCGFRAVYEARAGQVLCVQAPGCAPSDFWNYTFQHIPRPLWPWDDALDWAVGNVDELIVKH